MIVILSTTSLVQPSWFNAFIVCNSKLYFLYWYPGWRKIKFKPLKVQWCQWLNKPLEDFHTITSRTYVLLNPASSLQGTWKMLTAPQGEGQWSGWMNPQSNGDRPADGTSAHPQRQNLSCYYMLTQNLCNCSIELCAMMLSWAKYMDAQLSW